MSRNTTLMLVRRLPLTAILAIGLVGPAVADDDDGARAQVNVRDHGAVCNGQHDDTLAFTRALNAVPAGENVFVPVGKCVVTQTLVITKPVTISGTDFGSR